MDQNDPSRRTYIQPPLDPHARQQTQQHRFQQQQLSVSGPQHTPQNFNAGPSQFTAQSPTTQYHQQTVALPEQSSQARADPTNAQLYFATQGMSYGASPQTHFAGRPRGQEDIKPSRQTTTYGAYMYGGRSDLQPQTVYHQIPQPQTPQAATSETLHSQYQQSPAAQYYTGPQQGQNVVLASNYGSTHYTPASHTPSTSIITAPTLQSTMLQPVLQPAYPQTPQQREYEQRHDMMDIQQPQQMVQPQYSQSTSERNEQGLLQYQTALRRIFTHVQSRALREVPQLLQDITRYLTAHFLDLGLASDGENRSDENNLKLWEGYNRAWLTTLQCQLDLAQAIVDGHNRAEDLYILDRATLERLTAELVLLSDRVEKYGLVDYQMGVAEDEIIEHVFRCFAQLDKLEEAHDEQADAGAAQVSDNPDEMRS